MFPIILALFFKAAFFFFFYMEAFSSIPVAVICENSDAKKTFKSISDNLKTENKPLLKADYNISEADAEKKLKSNDISGIIYVGDTLKLKVLANTGDDNTKQSILDNFVGQYNANSSIIKDVAKTHPENIEKVIFTSSQDITYNKEHKFVSKSADNLTQYYYNLLAMACLFTALCGLEIAINNQGNFSDLGLRRNISPVNKLKIIVAELFSGLIFNYVLNVMAFSFIIVVLKIDLTFHLPYALLALFVSTMTGMSLGFLLGSIPSKKRGIKEALSIAVIMTSCFLSGLMIGTMRIVVEEHCPFINKINPAALISDSFYSLANYNDLGRYYQDIGTLFILTIIFTISSFLLTRRKKYASI